MNAELEREARESVFNKLHEAMDGLKEVITTKGGLEYLDATQTYLKTLKETSDTQASVIMMKVITLLITNPSVASTLDQALDGLVIMAQTDIGHA